MEEFNKYIDYNNVNMIIVAKVHKYSLNLFLENIKYYVTNKSISIKDKSSWYYFIIRIDKSGKSLENSFVQYDDLSNYYKLFKIDSDDELNKFKLMLEHCRKITHDETYRKLNDLILQCENI